MKAPTDKRNDTIQIIVTTACDLFNCSNCTQLLPFRKDARHMSVECFRKAVESVLEWPGVVALFGGNPCAHPRFEELCAILRELIPEQRRRGLWSNALMGKGGVVRETFYPHGRFNLNAHADAEAAREIDEWLPGKLIETSRNRLSWHSPVLMSRQDLGLTEAAWVGLRESCDINQTWSAAIRQGEDGEPYAYFCEVAAALDGVRGVNNGIRATPGWWREKMLFFERQVRNCCDGGGSGPSCGVPLRLLGHTDRSDTYDVTRAWADRVASERRGRVELAMHDALPQGTDRPTDYQAHRTNKPLARID